MTTAIAFSRQIKATLVHARAQRSSEKISFSKSPRLSLQPAVLLIRPVGWGVLLAHRDTQNWRLSLVIALLLEFKGLH